jgi:hypothetical protein
MTVHAGVLQDKQKQQQQQQQAWQLVNCITWASMLLRK